MSDLLADASAWLDQQRTAFMSIAVTYARGTSTLNNLAASVGKTVFMIDNGVGFTERIEGRDYLVTAADLILDAAVVLPKPGDRIRETQGTKTFSYEVMAPGNEPAYRYSDPYRKTLRIHTKLVAIEGA